MSLNLHLEHFENAFTMDTSAQLVITTVANISGQDATIDLSGYSVSASTFGETFYIKTDTDIVGDASSVWYYVDKTKWTNSTNTMNPIHGAVSTGQYVDNDDIGKDFIREIARQCFGTHLGSDLFTNESAMYNDISSQCAAVSTDINSKISAADTNNGNISGILTDGNSLKYLDDSFDGSNNITKLMFNALYDLSAGRFQDISSNYSYSEKGSGFYKLPFATGDQIEFKLTLSPHPQTFTAVPTKPSNTALEDRVYRCRLTLT